jgi:hypothetical protein
VDKTASCVVLSYGEIRDLQGLQPKSRETAKWRLRQLRGLQLHVVVFTAFGLGLERDCWTSTRSEHPKET